MDAQSPRGTDDALPGWWVQEPALPKRLQLYVIFKQASCPLRCVVLCPGRRSADTVSGLGLSLMAYGQLCCFASSHVTDPHLWPISPVVASPLPRCHGVTGTGPHPPRDLGGALTFPPSFTSRNLPLDISSYIDTDALNYCASFFNRLFHSFLNFEQNLFISTFKDLILTSRQLRMKSANKSAFIDYEAIF